MTSNTLIVALILSVLAVMLAVARAAIRREEQRGDVPTLSFGDVLACLVLFAVLGACGYAMEFTARRDKFGVLHWSNRQVLPAPYDSGYADIWWDEPSDGPRPGQIDSR